MNHSHIQIRGSENLKNSVISDRECMNLIMIGYLKKLGC